MDESDDRDDNTNPVFSIGQSVEQEQNLIKLIYLRRMESHKKYSC